MDPSMRSTLRDAAFARYLSSYWKSDEEFYGALETLNKVDEINNVDELDGLAELDDFLPDVRDTEDTAQEQTGQEASYILERSSCTI